MNYSKWIAIRILLSGEKSISKLAFLLGIGSIALGIIVIIIAIAITYGFEKEIKYKLIKFSADYKIVNYLSDSDSEIKPLTNDSFQQKLLKLNSVEFTPFTEGYALLKASNSIEGVQLKGVSKGWDSTIFKQKLYGKLISFSDSNYSSEIVISNEIAKKLQLKLNNRTRLYFIKANSIKVRPVIITGIYESGLVEFDRQTVLCDAKLLAKIYNWDQNAFQGFNIHIVKNADTIGLYQKLTELVPYNASLITANEIFKPIYEWLNLQHQNALFIILLLFIIGIINMSSSILLLIHEKIHTIALLKTIGANSIFIQKIFIIISFFLIASGVLIGNVIAVLLLFIQDSTGFLKLDSESYFIQTVPVSWEWLLFFTINISIVVLCTLAMYIPIFFVTQLSPVKALKT